MRRTWYAAALAVAPVLALAGCGSDDPSGSPGPSPSAPTTSAATASPPPSSASSTTSGTPTELTWEPVPGPVRDAVTVGGDWRLTVRGNGSSWSLDDGGTSSGGGRSGWRVSDALLDEDWAVVVLQDKSERRPSTATVTDLGTGDTFEVDARSEVPTTNGGTWALGGGHLVHATLHQGAYCLADVDLASRTSTLGWCAPARTGFNGAHVTPGGGSVLSFDTGRPSCRTLMSVSGADGSPFPGVPDCQAWDGLRTEDGAVWSVVTNEHRIEEADFWASSGGTTTELGPGTAGTLVWCGGAAWFVRDPQQEGDPASLMRWSAEAGLTTAYESPGGRAFLSTPRCGGDAITVTAMAEAGDEQVTASLR